MSEVPWTHSINFASALLLHSCMTVLLKETLNSLELGRRLLLRSWRLWRRRPGHDKTDDQIQTSAVLDAYTSIVSRDQDGELAELYFTNTGCILLAVSLASSVAMNLLLSSLVLNTIVASTFGLAFIASLFSIDRGYTLPVMALRRAGRFIWSDTPFVNFFSLIYIATVLHGRSTLRLQDYVTFRCIAILELLFMKAKLAASTPEKQIDLLKRLVASEWAVITAVSRTTGKSHSKDARANAHQMKAGAHELHPSYPTAKRDLMVPFTTRQRLTLMFLKTSIGYHHGCLQGNLGPVLSSRPSMDTYSDHLGQGYRVYSLSEDIMIIADQAQHIPPKTRRARLIMRAHGILLRQVGKVRVIYCMRVQESGVLQSDRSVWHSNVNLVTGVSKVWLDENYKPERSGEMCVVAGLAGP